MKKSVKIPKKFSVSPPIRGFRVGTSRRRYAIFKPYKGGWDGRTLHFPPIQAKEPDARIWYVKSAGNVFFTPKSEKNRKYIWFPILFGKKDGDRQKEIRYLYDEKVAAGRELWPLSKPGYGILFFFS